MFFLPLARHGATVRGNSRVLVVVLLAGILPMPGVCQTATERAREFIRDQQKALFAEQQLDPARFRRDQLEWLGSELPELAQSLAKNLDKLPSEYEHPLLPYLQDRMARIASLGPEFLARVGLKPLADPPIIATVPTGLGTPVTTFHVPSGTTIVWFDAGSHTFLFQLARLVAQSLPVVNGSPRLEACLIRPRINGNGQIRQSFQGLLESYIYDANMSALPLASTSELQRSVAIDGLYRPALLYVLAHEYAHAVLRHATDAQAGFPEERRGIFKGTFYKQVNEDLADKIALGLTVEAGFREPDAVAGAWLFLKGHEILSRALALAQSNSEFAFGYLGVPTRERPLFPSCGDHPPADVRLTFLEVYARLAWGPENNAVFCPAYTLDWILEYLWKWARPRIQERYNHEDKLALPLRNAAGCF